MSWQKCPVCEGRGHVDGGFYADLRAEEIVVPRTGPQVARCRSCDGKGVLLAVAAAFPLDLTPYEKPNEYPPKFVPYTQWTGDEVPFPYKTTCGGDGGTTTFPLREGRTVCASG